jgi:enoyl-CoA hydratase
MSETVSMSIRDRVAVVTIERPQHRNAVDLPTSKDLLSAFKSFDVNDEVDVAILTGAGGSFCAGADLKALAAGERKPVNPDGEFAPMGPTRLRLQKPVIAAIEGPAVAGGMELALWCDLRIVARSAVLGIFNRRFGVPLVDLGTIRLPRLIGQGRALELILTGRPVEAQEALAIGLVNAVVDDGTALENALIWAKKISAFPQNALRNDRMSVMEQWDLDEVSAIANEIKHGLATIQSGETLSGSNRFSNGVGRHGKFT